MIPPEIQNAGGTNTEKPHLPLWPKTQLAAQISQGLTHTLIARNVLPLLVFSPTNLRPQT